MLELGVLGFNGLESNTYEISNEGFKAADKDRECHSPKVPTRILPSLYLPWTRRGLASSVGSE